MASVGLVHADTYRGVAHEDTYTVVLVHEDTCIDKSYLQDTDGILGPRA